MERILVVDDEPATLAKLKSYLDKDYDIIAVCDSHKAMAVFEKERPSVIIVDVNMPGLDGFELSKRMRATNGDVEVIMTMGLGDVDRAMSSPKLGPVDFLLKPIGADELESAIDGAFHKLHAKERMFRFIEERIRDDRLLTGLLES